MPVNVLVPQLGESIVEATVSEWLKQPGEQVAVGDPLVRLETDKVDLEVGAEQAGVLARIERQAGEDVQVGQVLGVIDETGASRTPAPNSSAAAGAPDVSAGAEVRSAGEQGDEGGGPSGAAEAREGPPAASQESTAGKGQATEEQHEATPVARRVAEDLGINLAQVPGSGPKGRVTKEDVEAFGRSKPAPAAARGQAAPVAQEAIQAGGDRPSVPAAGQAGQPAGGAIPETGRPEVRQRMSRRRQTIARRLVEAQQTAAMLTTFNEIDMSVVMEIRKRRRDTFKERHGVGLGFMSFFVKASIGALKAFPRLNAEIQGNEFVLKNYYDIGIAVGAEEGLVVPVLRDADRMSFAEIEATIKELATKVSQGTLSLEDLRGGTFTITNGGVFGSLLSTPILNPPQVGILGLHKIGERPMALNGEVAIRPMMYVALTYDHRIVDGREAVQFLVRVKELIEDPETLLLEG